MGIPLDLLREFCRRIVSAQDFKIIL